jgi:hypothetical protein
MPVAAARLMNPWELASHCIPLDTAKRPSLSSTLFRSQRLNPRCERARFCRSNCRNISSAPRVATLLPKTTQKLVCLLKRLLDPSPNMADEDRKPSDSTP